MNILVFTQSRAATNTVRPELEIYLALARRGHHLTVAMEADTEYGRIFREQGVEVIDLKPEHKVCPKSIRVLRRELRKRPYDILYSTNSKVIPSAAFAAIGFATRFVTYRGTTGGLYRHDPSAYLTHLNPRVDGIVCVSDAVREDVLRRVWRHRERVVRIYKGHDLAWYDQSPADLGQFGIGEDAFVVICAVNARPSKGIPVLLEAANRWADHARLHLLMIGRNHEQYAPLVAQNLMRDRIHMAGFRADAPELIVASDLLVQPSISGEGLPRAVMEAMGYGTPSVVTTTGGSKEVVQTGVNGIVVPTNDPAAIAAAVTDLYHHPDRIAEMSRQCREAIATRYSLEETARQYEAYFQALVHGLPTPAD